MVIRDPVGRHTTLTKAMSALALFVASFLCAGCRTPGPPVIPPSTTAEVYYLRAKEEYLAILDFELPPHELRERLEDPFRRLKAAVDVEKDCPLFHSRLGELFLERGEPDIAYGHLRQSVELCPDWVAGWIGLARWATSQLDRHPGKGEEVRHHLKQAEAAIASLERRTRAHVKMGDHGPLQSDMTTGDSRSNADPSPSAARQTELLITWLEQDANWLSENAWPQLALGRKPSVPTRIDRLFRRLRAQVGHQRAVLAMEEGEPAQAVIALLEEALKWDKDYASCQLDMAAQLRSLGRFSEAESWLHPFVDGNDPMYARNGRIRFEAGRLFYDWYLAGRRTDIFAKANEHLSVLTEVLNPRHSNGLYLYGWLLTCGAAYRVDLPVDQRLALLDYARELRDRTERIVGRPPVEPLSSEIATVESLLNEKVDHDG